MRGLIVVALAALVMGGACRRGPDPAMEARIAELGLELRPPGPPAGPIVRAKRSGRHLFMAGQGPSAGPDGVRLTGKSGDTNVGIFATADRHPGESLPHYDPLYHRRTSTAEGRVSQYLGVGTHLSLI